MEYKHLTPTERESIMNLSIQGYGVRAIAHKMGRSSSTISRELARNRDKTNRSYSASVADKRYRQRRMRCRPRLKLANAEIKERLLAYLDEGWSPEQIVGRVKLEGKQGFEVSMPTIYRSINRGLLPKRTKDCLMRKGKPYRRKDII
ncbi:MAG: IS30 family transposase [Synergistaceae bacterium]|nr:IS30 family transposase [Synergistaceae bacterium]